MKNNFNIQILSKKWSYDYEGLRLCFDKDKH